VDVQTTENADYWQSKMPSLSGGLVLRAGAVYFALVFGAGFLLGSIRVPFLVPRLGERVAELLEAPVMLVVIFFASRHVVRRFALASLTRASLVVGLFALVLLLAAEVLLAVAISGRSVLEYISGRDPVSGSVYLASLLVYAALPWLHARRSRGSIIHKGPNKRSSGR
jgi:hypothetical protein